MPHEWYRYETKVIELAEFLVQSEEIASTDELLEYFKDPKRYTEVWDIYDKEILGTDSSLLKYSKNVSSHHPVKIELIGSCAC